MSAPTIRRPRHLTPSGATHPLTTLLRAAARRALPPVDRTVAANGLLHWRTSDGFFEGLSYIKGQSGAFLIRAVYEGADGQKRYIVLNDEDV